MTKLKRDKQVATPPVDAFDQVVKMLAAAPAPDAAARRAIRERSDEAAALRRGTSDYLALLQINPYDLNAVYASLIALAEVGEDHLRFGRLNSIALAVHQQAIKWMTGEDDDVYAGDVESELGGLATIIHGECLMQAMLCQWRPLLTRLEEMRRSLAAHPWRFVPREQGLSYNALIAGWMTVAQVRCSEFAAAEATWQILCAQEEDDIGDTDAADVISELLALFTQELPVTQEQIHDLCCATHGELATSGVYGRLRVEAQPDIGPELALKAVVDVWTYFVATSHPEINTVFHHEQRAFLGGSLEPAATANGLKEFVGQIMSSDMPPELRAMVEKAGFISSPDAASPGAGNGGKALPKGAKKTEVSPGRVWTPSRRKGSDF